MLNDPLPLNLQRIRTFSYLATNCYITPNKINRINKINYLMPTLYYDFSIYPKMAFATSLSKLGFILEPHVTRVCVVPLCALIPFVMTLTH